MIGEQRAVRALFRAETMLRGALEVELRASPSTTDPRSGEAIAVPPLVVLWVCERPLAVRMRSLVAISRFPPHVVLADLVEEHAAIAGLPVERVPEAGLWRLFHRPPHARLAS